MEWTNEELVIRIKAGTDIADNMLALWERNKRFIYSIAMHYKGLAEMEDLEQEGYLALYDAVDGYDPELGYKFLTYAEYYIKRRMGRYIKNNSTVRIPEHEIAKISAYKKIVNACQIHLGRNPTRHEIASLMHISYEKVIDMEKATQMAKLRSLDSLFTIDDDSTTVGDMVANDVDIGEDVLENVQQEQLKSVLWPMVDSLPEQQREVIRQRYQGEKTPKTIGENLGISLENVKQIEAKAMRSLRSSRNTRLLKPFLDDVYSMGLATIGIEGFNRTWTSSTERAALLMYEEKQ